MLYVSGEGRGRRATTLGRGSFSPASGRARGMDGPLPCSDPRPWTSMAYCGSAGQQQQRGGLGSLPADGVRLRRGVWGEIHNTGERLPEQVEEVDLLQCEKSHLVSLGAVRHEIVIQGECITVQASQITLGRLEVVVGLIQGSPRFIDVGLRSRLVEVGGRLIDDLLLLGDGISDGLREPCLLGCKIRQT